MDEVLTVRSFMAKDLVTFRLDTDVYEAIDTLVAKRISGAAVVDSKGKLVGIISEKDCLHVLTHDAYHNLPGGKVSDYMSDIVMTIHPDTDIYSVAVMFLQNYYRRLPVVEDGKLVGQISRRDILAAIKNLKK